MTSRVDPVNPQCTASVDSLGTSRNSFRVSIVEGPEEEPWKTRNHTEEARCAPPRTGFAKGSGGPASSSFMVTAGSAAFDLLVGPHAVELPRSFEFDGGASPVGKAVAIGGKANGWRTIRRLRLG